LRSLFLTYDGLLSPLGQSQILPYMRGLRARGHAITILSFEQGANAEPPAQAALRSQLMSEGIQWVARRYHKRPSAPATLYDVLQGAAVARWLIARDGIEILHARSYVPTLMALLVAGHRRVIFDMRGFWADERVDGQLWNLARPLPRTIYQMAKALERWGLRRADHVVVLTHAAARILGDIPGVAKPLPPVSVIPTCVDLERFRSAPDKAARRRELGLPTGRILVYQGSIGTWYMLDQMVAFVRRLKQRWPDVLWLILAPAEHELIRQKCSGAGLHEGSDYRLQALSHQEVPRWLGAADAAIFFIKPSYSKLSSCPTKFGECLGCGIPVVANGGVGDVAEIIAKHQIGTALDRFDEPAYDAGISQLESLFADPELPSRCRQAAEADFALGDAIAQYDRIYRSLALGTVTASVAP
jgi:glycosyltransferase involved in cell wall biosynthesis